MATKHIQPASKKIKKTKRTVIVHSQDPRLKKYKTFTKAAKSIIIQSLMNELNFPIYEEEFPRVRFINHLKALDHNDKNSYNESLQKVLRAYVDSDVLSKQNLKQWRRKVKDWIENYDKPERRGGVLVPDDKLEWFKERLIPILHNLPKKSFDLLRKHLLPVFEEMHKNSDKFGEPFNLKTCSKHFWYDFLKKNPDINELYQEIPITCTSKMQIDMPMVNTPETTDTSYLFSPLLPDFTITSPFPNTRNEYNMDSLANEVASNSYTCETPSTPVFGFSQTSYSFESAKENEAIDFKSFKNHAFPQFQNLDYLPAPQGIFYSTPSLCHSSGGPQNEFSFSEMVSGTNLNNLENQTTHFNQNNIPNTRAIESVVMNIYANNNNSSLKDCQPAQDMLSVSDFLTTDSEEPVNKGTDLFAHKLECLIEKVDYWLLSQSPTPSKGKFDQNHQANFNNDLACLN